MRTALLLACAGLAGCTATFSIQPIHHTTIKSTPIPVLEVEREECQPVDEPPAVPPVPKLSPSARDNIDKAYQELIEAYKALRLYAKGRYKVEHESHAKCTPP